ncbi:MAG: reverse transcriptase-like protein, partial [Bifidobacteriaceae bacterium]|nr:reverse transcriptase-like protein [Bifidobacteriaceae bacterium]
MRLVVEADGGSRGNPGLAGFGAVVREAPGGRILAERAGYLGDAVTNNVAEYAGLIAGLKAAAAIDPAAELEVRMDSKLVVSQLSGAWKIKNAALAELAAEARELLGGRAVKFTWVPRARNQAADALANQAMDRRGSIARDFAADAARPPADAGSAPADAGSAPADAAPAPADAGSAPAGAARPPADAGSAPADAGSAPADAARAPAGAGRGAER